MGSFADRCYSTTQGEVRYPPIPHSPLPEAYGMNDAGLAASGDMQLWLLDVSPSPPRKLDSFLTDLR